MAYKFSFADNEIYSASDVNEITKRLITSGIEDSFTDGVAYNVSKFNEAGQLLYTSGVVPETCHTLKVSKISDAEILINPGLAFFNDGAVIEIEPGGETLSFVSGVKNYVYLKNELIDKNICCPVCTTEVPTGDYVLLAEIDENGAVNDKRTYAKGKLPGYQSVAGNVLVIDEVVTQKAETTDKTLSGSAVFNIGNNDYEYILVMTPFTSGEMPCIGAYDIMNQTYLAYQGYKLNNLYLPSTGRYHDDQIISHSEAGGDEYTALTFSISDGKLTVNYVKKRNNVFNAGWPYQIAIKLFLF